MRNISGENAFQMKITERKKERKKERKNKRTIK